MISRFGREAELLGYRRVIVNISGCQLYYRSEAEQLTALVFFECPTGREFRLDQIETILEQIRERFAVTPGQRRVIQPLVVTSYYSVAANRLYGCSFPLWFADEAYGRFYAGHMDATLEPVAERFAACLTSETSRMEMRREPQEDPYGRYRELNPGRVAGGTRVRTFGLTPVNTVLIVLNVLTFIWVSMRGSTENAGVLLHFGALFYPRVFEAGEYYRLFTYMFLHAGISHIFNNMLVLAFLGDNLERRLGSAKYLILYLVSGIGAGLMSVGWDRMHQTPTVGVGASGAIFAVVGAMIYVLIVHKGRLEDLSLSRMLLFVALSIYSGFTNSGVDNIAHIGGFLLGFLLGMLFYRRKK